MPVYAPRGNRANTQVLLLNPRPYPSSSLEYLIVFPPGFLTSLFPQTHHYDPFSSDIFTRDSVPLPGSSYFTPTPLSFYIALAIPGTMATGPKHRVVSCRLGFNDIFQAALCDVVTMPPAERGKAMVTFDLTAPCQVLCELVTRMMPPHIQNWCTQFEAVSRDPGMPLGTVEAIRLERGAIFLPKYGYLAVLIPLTNSKCQVHMVGRNGSFESKDLQAEDVVMLADTAMHVTGGSLRFLCIVYDLLPQEQHQPYRTAA
ncbi:hypothetical protein BKA56DRAFT_106986 [Ilyonectria sp. MPI-CAGE-AT-0026]|nr:hypothetical protein BKA56DRAFT_106986 [Ilyonectria sp. MPI-CAGE-AT-0026]